MEPNKEKKMGGKKEDGLRDLWDNTKHTICIIGVPEGKRKGPEKNI